MTDLKLTERAPRFPRGARSVVPPSEASPLEVVELIVTCADGHPRRRLDRVSVGIRDGVPVAPMAGLPASTSATFRFWSGCTCRMPPSGWEGASHAHVTWQPAGCPCCGRRPPVRAWDAVVSLLLDAFNAGERRVADRL